MNIPHQTISCQLSSLGKISLNYLYCFVMDKRILSSALSSLCHCLCGWEQSGSVYPASCAGLAEFFEPYVSARFVAVIPRELQFGLCCYPQAECVSPAGQPAHGLAVHPEGAAAQEENPRAHFSHQLPGWGLHGRVTSCCPC